jgi:hypothetical protein
MPPLPSVPRTCRIRVYQHIADHEVQNVLHATVSTGAFNGTDMADVAGAVQGTFSADAVTNAYWSSDWHLDRTTCEDISSMTGAFGESSAGAGAGGASQQSTSARAAVISWPINARYRGGHPRTYIAGISDDNNLDGRLFTTAAVAQVLTLAQDLQAAVNGVSMSGGGTLNLSVVHYTGPVALEPYPRTDYLGAPFVAQNQRSQRRRYRPTPAGVL